MNWTRLGKHENVLSEQATAAENRLKVIKRATKSFKKSVEDSLRTSSRNKHENLDLRKRRCAEFNLGYSVAASVQTLQEEKPTIVAKGDCQSPLNTIFERYANFEKTVGHMLARHDMEIEDFWGNSNTPITNLLMNELPAASQDKKRFEQMVKRKQQVAHNLEKEQKKLESMQAACAAADGGLGDETTISDEDQEALLMQAKKKDAVARELECLEKDVALESDKMTSKLLSLSSRENRYASSVVELLRIKKKFYQQASEMAMHQLQEIERILKETHHRPVFGERLEHHLAASERSIAVPIALAVSRLRKSGLNDEGLFRLSPPQIKLNKLKANIDSNFPLAPVLIDGDVHLYCGILKSYLRELPTPLLGNNYERWMTATSIEELEDRVEEFKDILNKEVTDEVKKNIQFLFKFLVELSAKSEDTKMNVHNIAIVLGPNLLWRLPSEASWSQTHSGVANQPTKTLMTGEQDNVDRMVVIVSTLIQNYDEIFEEDFAWSDYIEDDQLDQQIERLRKEMEQQQLQEGLRGSCGNNNGGSGAASKMFGSFNTSGRHSHGATALDAPTQERSPSYKKRLDANILKIWSSSQ